MEDVALDTVIEVMWLGTHKDYYRYTADLDESAAMCIHSSRISIWKMIAAKVNSRFNMNCSPKFVRELFHYTLDLKDERLVAPLVKRMNTPQGTYVHLIVCIIVSS